MTFRHPQFGDMCEICYTRLTPNSCVRDTDGTKWDVCKGVCALWAGIREETGLTDDGRRWWVVGAHTWPGVHIYQARTGRSAVAAYRRDLIAADRANGASLRRAAELASVAGLHVAAGPLTTPAAFDYDFARHLADTVTQFSADYITIPLGPIYYHDMRAVLRALGAEKVDQIRRRVLTGYRPTCTCCGRPVAPLDADRRCGHCGANRSAHTHNGDQPCAPTPITRRAGRV